MHGVFEDEDRGLGGWGRVNEWEPNRVFCWRPPKSHTSPLGSPPLESGLDL